MEDLAFLRLNSYGGYTETKVLVIGVRPKTLIIEAIVRTKLAGRDRWLEPGKRARVPKTAVRWM
jgi:hypothetical protein